MWGRVSARLYRLVPPELPRFSPGRQFWRHLRRSERGKENKDRNMVFWAPILFGLAVLLCAGVAVARAPASRSLPLMAQKLLRYIVLFPVGVMGLWAALGRLVFPEQAAHAIGWAFSPFQFEVGVANLGIGMAGVIAAFYANWGARGSGGDGLRFSGWRGGGPSGADFRNRQHGGRKCRLHSLYGHAHATFPAGITGADISAWGPGET